MPKKLTVVLACILLSVALGTIASAQYDWEDYDYYSSDDAAAMFGLGMAACAIWVIVWFIIWLLIAIWVYKDAEKRGKSGALWLIIVILLGLIGIIIWLIIRPPIGGEKPAAAEPDRRCPNCGRSIPMDARTCPYCGKNFEETTQ